MSSSSEAEFDDQAEEEIGQAASSEEEFQADDDDDSDVPLSSLKKITPVAATKNEMRGDDDSIDSDIPLSALKSSSSTKKKAKGKSDAKTPAAKKKTVAKKKKATPKAKPPAISASSSSTSNGNSSDHRTASAAYYGSDCKKGLLVQRLLCRWWYAVQWPDPKSIDTPPKHYDPLDGLPGVYVCTSGDKVGRILDKRDRESCPNFANFAKKPASELIKLLLKALERQKELLTKAEGSETSPIEKEINVMIKWTNKLKGETVDKEAVKVLKAAKLSLP